MSDFWAAEPVFLVPDPRDLTDEQIGVLCDVKKAMGRNIDLAGPDWPLDPRPAAGGRGRLRRRRRRRLGSGRNRAGGR